MPDPMTTRGILRWQAAMATALYGPAGFFVRPGPGPAGHFRTSAHASPQFAEALLTLLRRLDQALGRPDPLEVVDVGAGRGELLSTLAGAAPASMAGRLRLTAVEQAPAPPPRPAGPPIAWVPLPPTRVTGLLLATEWLDNIPVEVAEVDDAGVARYVLVDPATGVETLGPPVTGADAAWLDRWWPVTVPGSRAEIGRPRDTAWRRAVATVRRGVALAVDYGHTADTRPPLGTLTGFRHGREVPPVPDGSCDLTAHVALDSLVATGGVLLRQAAALRALGVRGARPPLALASADPSRYLRRLAAAGSAAELTDPAGLGGHFWLLQPVGVPAEAVGIASG